MIASSPSFKMYSIWILGVVACCVLAFSSGIYSLLVLPIALPIGYSLIFRVEALYYLMAAALPVSFTMYFGGMGLEVASEPLMIALCGIGLLYFIVKWRDIKTLTLLHPLSLLILAYFLWVCITFFVSDHAMISLKYILAKGWMIGGMFVASLYFMRKLSSWKKFFWSMYIPLTLAVIIIMTRHGLVGFSFSGINFVLHPFFPNHVDYAAVIVLFIPFIHLALNWYERGSWQKRLLYISLLLYIIAVFLSFTRAAYIVLIGYPFIYLMFKYKLSKLVLIGAVIGSVLFFAKFVYDKQFIPFAPRFEKTITHDKFGNLVTATYNFEDISTMERLYRWVAAYYMIQEKPVLGYGPGTFYESYKPYGLTMFQTYVSDNPTKSGVHNYYLLLLIEIGGVGLLIFLTLIGSTIIKIEQVIHHHRSSEPVKLILYACGMSFVGFLLLSLINDILEVDKIAIFFYLAIATTVIMSCREFKVDE